MEQSLRGERRERIWDQKDNWRGCHDPNGNASVKKKNASVCLNIYSKADRGHEGTGPHEFLSRAQGVLPQPLC